jgi:hypothetical protein
MDTHDHLTDKQRKYVEHLAAGMDSRTAAKGAGYSDSYSRVAASRLAKKPEIAKAIEVIRKKGCEMAAYDLAAAMKEAESAATFARLHRNPMALVKATELRAKLSGLLIDRLEVVPPVDLKGALFEARTRVITIVDITPRVPTTTGLAAVSGPFPRGPELND